MPNGDSHGDNYNAGRCIEKHRAVDHQFQHIEGRFRAADTRLDRIESRLWGLVVLALIQVLGIASLLFSTIL